MRTVQNVIDSKINSYNYISPDALVIDALQMLNSVNLSYLVVMDDDNYKGVFCERDYTRNVILKGRSSNTTKVGEVMTTDLPIVSLTDSVESCMNVMNSHKARYLLAYDGPNFEAVITIHDLLRQVIANKENVFDTSLANQLIDHDEGGGRIY
jgi:signal-transduction protein with cAMP-binding, CBS, and nucleotidyltransferase domain